MLKGSIIRTLWGEEPYILHHTFTRRLVRIIPGIPRVGSVHISSGCELVESSQSRLESERFLAERTLVTVQTYIYSLITGSIGTHQSSIIISLIKCCITSTDWTIPVLTLCLASSRNVDIVTVTRLVTPLKSRDKVASSSQGIGANYSIVTFQ